MCNNIKKSLPLCNLMNNNNNKFSVILSKKTMALIVILSIASLFQVCHGALTVEQKLRQDPDLSQFYTLFENNPIANYTLALRKATLFAPTNQAFQKYKGPLTDSIVLYHMTNVAQTLERLENSVTTLYDGNPPLWISKLRRLGPGGKEDIFVNNAKVLTDRSNYQAPNGKNQQQVLHVIDEVLEPVLSTVSESPIENPDAFQFLNQSENIGLDQHRVRSFRQRVYQNGKESIFKTGGKNTFFIPVDEGFKPPPRPEKIDKKVIDGHVIPDQVIFTRATPGDAEFDTLAFGDMMRVTVSFTTQTEGKASRAYVKSNTLIGDANHATGVVMAEIVKANIPVRNGVVHLIHRPLMVVDTTVTQFLQSFQEKEDGPLYKLYEVIMDHGSDFMTRITQMKQLTLFAPSNAAWNNSNLNNILRNKAKLREILNMHLVEEKLPLEKIANDNIVQVESAADRKNLYFNVFQGVHNKTLTVEGGGVNATVIEPNIAATNGIVHIIDRVLGVPYSTVFEKLATDPALNKTFFLGQNQRFNEQLNDTHKRFTYFVPRDTAWAKAELHFPSAHKKLFMRDFQYHAQQILERHLIVDQAYTMAELKELLANNESAILPTVRDILKIKVKEIDKSYYLEWQGEKVLVSRPDVECTNGIIHVIDTVLLRDTDVRVTGGAGSMVPFILAHLASLLLARFLL